MTNVRTEVEGPPWAPTEDDLPSSDGRNLESERQGVQIGLLARAAKLYYQDREDVYVGADMVIYFSLAEEKTHDFRGPDVFVVTGTKKREHKSWVVWQEGKGPDVIIEVLSDSTRRRDMTVKKEVYATRLRAPEYFWYDPFTGERAGFILHGGEYVPIEPDQFDGLPSRILGLTLVRWHGVAEDIEATWLRWAAADGTLLPTPEEAERERAEAERARAEAERERAERAEQEAAAQRQRIAELEARLARYEPRTGEDPAGSA
jgi:Uma2 family endonuclease